MTIEEVKNAALAKNPSILLDYLDEEIALQENCVTEAEQALVVAQQEAQNVLDAAKAELQALTDTKASLLPPVEAPADPVEEATEDPAAPEDDTDPIDPTAQG